MGGEQFWGLPIPVSNSPVTFELEGKCLHVTHIAFSPSGGRPGERGGHVRLEVSTKNLRKQRLVLATLSDAHPQAVLDATFFEADSYVRFYAIGSKGSSVHLTGVVVSSETDNSPNGFSGVSEKFEEDDDEESYVPNEGDDVEPKDDESNDSDDESDDSDDESNDSDDELAEEDELEAAIKAQLEKKKRRRSSSFEREKRTKNVSEDAFVTPSSKKKKKSTSSGAVDFEQHEGTPYRARKSGLKVAVLKQGFGSKAVPGQKMKISYQGYLVKNGKLFDESAEGRPLKFRVGHAKVIKGIDEGVLGMKKGERRALLVPSNLGYGTAGAADVVPPNAALKFVIERAE